MLIRKIGLAMRIGAISQQASIPAPPIATSHKARKCLSYRVDTFSQGEIHLTIQACTGKCLVANKSYQEFANLRQGPTPRKQRGAGGSPTEQQHLLTAPSQTAKHTFPKVSLTRSSIMCSELRSNRNACFSQQGLLSSPRSPPSKCFLRSPPRLSPSDLTAVRNIPRSSASAVASRARMTWLRDRRTRPRAKNRGIRHIPPTNHTESAATGGAQ